MLRPQDSSLAMAIGRHARAWRERLALTQEEVAKAADLSSQVYARLERGGVLPSLPSLLRLCAVLDASPNDLLVDAPAPKASPQPNAEAARLARSVAGLAASDAKLLVPLVKRLAKKPRATKSR